MNLILLETLEFYGHIFSFFIFYLHSTLQKHFSVIWIVGNKYLFCSRLSSWTTPPQFTCWSLLSCDEYMYWYQLLPWCQQAWFVAECLCCTWPLCQQIHSWNRKIQPYYITSQCWFWTNRIFFIPWAFPNSVRLICVLISNLCSFSTLKNFWKWS